MDTRTGFGEIFAIFKFENFQKFLKIPDTHAFLNGNFIFEIFKIFKNEIPDLGVKSGNLQNFLQISRFQKHSGLEFLFLNRKFSEIFENFQFSKILDTSGNRRSRFQIAAETVKMTDFFIFNTKLFISGLFPTVKTKLIIFDQ